MFSSRPEVLQGAIVVGGLGRRVKKKAIVSFLLSSILLSSILLGFVCLPSLFAVNYQDWLQGLAPELVSSAIAQFIKLLFSTWIGK